MRALLDTHAFIWLATAPEVLSQAARQILGDEGSELFISAVTAWEIGFLVKRNRLALDVEPDVLITRAIRRHGIEEIPLIGTDALASTRLPELHHDPFDRILIAIAMRENMSLVSKDDRLAKYPGVRVIW